MEKNMEKPYVAGMDIGGTNTIFGIVNARGEILGSSAIKTRDYEKIEDYIEAICSNLNELIVSLDCVGKIRGMGVGAPNGNYYRGTIEQAPNLQWKGIIPLAQMLQDKLGFPVALTNDANAAAIGEMTYGVAKGMKHFIMITLGTGVGSGIVVDGKLVYGKDGFAGELGHVIVRENGRPCGCGRKGCLEAYCSATGIARTAKEILETTDKPSLLRDIPREALTSKDLYDAAVKGDAVALEIFKQTGELLGKAFANFVVFSSPEAIILFGGLTKAGDYIFKPIKEAMEANMLNIFKGKTKLLVSGMKDTDAAVLGASALGWEA